MNNKNKLYQSSLNHKVTPGETAWFKLENRLSKKRTAKKISQYKLFSIAAIMIALVAVVSVFFSGNAFNTKTENTTQLVQMYKTDIEELNISDDPGIYEIDKLQELKSAYVKLGSDRNL